MSENLEVGTINIENYDVTFVFLGLDYLPQYDLIHLPRVQCILILKRDLFYCLCVCACT